MTTRPVAKEPFEHRLKVGIVVHRFPPYLGGCEFYAFKLAEGLSRAGHEVSVYTTKHPARPEYPFKVRSFVNWNPPGSGYFFWPAFIQPSVLAEVRELDILHSFDFSMYATFASVLVGKICGVPVVVQCSYHPPEAMPHPWLKRAYDKSFGKFILSEANALVIQTEVELAAVKYNVGVPQSNKVLVIPPGPIIDRTEPQQGFRDLHGLAGKFVLLYVGRIDSHKGIEHLLESVKNLAESHIPNLALVIVGESEAWYKWPRKVSALVDSLKNRIVFTGRLPEACVAAAYAESDLLVVPSKYESFGFTIIEALSYGTSVVSTRVGIAPEVIVDGSNGCLYDFGDVEGLKGAILQMAQHNGSVRQNAVDSVKEFRWERTLQRVTDLYCSLLAPSRSASI